MTRNAIYRLFAVTAVTSLVLVGCSPSATPPSSSPSDPGGTRETAATLTWSDEFDGSEGSRPNPVNWSYETGGDGWGNEELQYYTDSTENAALDGAGHLEITVRQVDPATTSLHCWYGACSFTSARLTTRNKQEFQYGRIESRMRLPAGGGIWPALWMLGTDISDVGWPQTGEIDALEFVGKSPNKVFGTLHGPGYSGGSAFSGVFDLGEPVPQQWHEVAVEWSPDSIVWTLDGVKFHQATPADIAPNEWVFKHPFFLLANVAVGGNFGGAVAEDFRAPQSLVIDYVRVYSLPGV